MFISTAHVFFFFNPRTVSRQRDTVSLVSKTFYIYFSIYIPLFFSNTVRISCLYPQPRFFFFNPCTFSGQRDTINLVSKTFLIFSFLFISLCSFPTASEYLAYLHSPGFSSLIFVVLNNVM